MHLAQGSVEGARCTLHGVCLHGVCLHGVSLHGVCLHGACNSVEQDTRGRSASPRRLGAAPARRRPAHGHPCGTATTRVPRAHAAGNGAGPWPPSARVLWAASRHPIAPQPCCVAHTHSHATCNRHHATDIMQHATSCPGETAVAPTLHAMPWPCHAGHPHRRCEHQHTGLAQVAWRTVHVVRCSVRHAC